MPTRTKKTTVAQLSPAKPSPFPDPHGFVSLKHLDRLSDLLLEGCPECRAKFTEKKFSAHGAVLKGQLRCSNGHLTAWNSSGRICMTRYVISVLTQLGEKAVKNNNSSFIVNAKIPSAAAMNGIRQTSIVGFLSLLGVETFTHQYNKGIISLRSDSLPVLV